MVELTAPLAIDLGDGLLLRSAMQQDIEPLAEFNVRIHSDSLDDPEHWLREWTYDLLRGSHPTTGLHNFTVVVDRGAGDRIVSSTGLIPQIWRYEDVAFAVGRPELIGTDEAHRRRGLIRRQMDVLHQWSAAQGHLAQVITGIPHYYRQFGYEMAIDLGGRRLFPKEVVDRLRYSDEEKRINVREATGADIPTLSALYARHCAASMVSRVRSEAEWHYEMTDSHKTSVYHRNFYMVEDPEERATLGYFECARWPKKLAICEIAAAPGHSLRRVALQAIRYLQWWRVQPANEAHKEAAYYFALGERHPAYRALERELVQTEFPYGWYVRTPDLCAFLRHIKPVLERRIARSVIAGYSGTLRLNCTVEKVALVWQRGELASVERFEAAHFFDGDAFFPGLSFLQLLFGFRSLPELHRACPDFSSGNGECYVALNALFPHRASAPVGLG